MSGLWRKEFRSVGPFLGLVLVLSFLGLIDEFLSDLPNTRPMARSYTSYIALDREETMLTFVLVFALASGLLVREFDNDTMEFLDSLPVSRTRLFLVKVTTALCVLLLFIVLNVGTGVFLHALSRNSLDRSFHVPLLVTAVALRACQCFVLFSLGLALSFLRRFGWLLMALMFWGYIALHERIPSIAVFDLLALTDSHFEGDRWIVPRRMLAVQMTLGVVSLAIAYGLFLGIGDRILRGFKGLTRSRLGNACMLTGAILLVIVSTSLVFYLMEKEFGDDPADENGVTVVYPSWGTSRSHSEHYEFIYPTNLTTGARRLIDDADSIEETVRGFLAADSGDPIVVDATSLLPRHAGIAFWDKIRLDLSTTDDYETLKSILGHETCHVFLERLSDSRLTEQMNSTRFFHEGVASYVEYHLFSPKQGVDALHSVAAVMHSRDEVDFSEMIDSDLLSARRDTDLVYPLGEIFVEACIERYGEPAIGKLVRALVREDAPRGLSGQDFWRDVFQACNYSLDDVLDEFFAKLDADVEEYQELIDTLPRLRGEFSYDALNVYVIIHWESIDGWMPVCRFRQSEDTPSRQYLPGERTLDELFSMDRSSFPGSSLWYQIGLSDGKGRVIYEPWLRVTLD
jgi:ABC-type transport system involved in multi-copper enzyme maturation permease subunit